MRGKGLPRHPISAPDPRPPSFLHKRKLLTSQPARVILHRNTPKMGCPRTAVFLCGESLAAQKTRPHLAVSLAPANNLLNPHFHNLKLRRKIIMAPHRNQNEHFGACRSNMINLNHTLKCCKQCNLTNISPNSIPSTYPADMMLHTTTSLLLAQPQIPWLAGCCVT